MANHDAEITVVARLRMLRVISSTLIMTRRSPWWAG